MPTEQFRVPDDLDGVRIDLVVARELGMSRTRASELIRSGDVLIDGRVAAKSAKVPAGASVEAAWEEPEQLRVTAQPVEGMRIVHVDDHVVVVDKPVGVAAHPATSWHGPTVLGGLAALGISVATSGPAERNGIVQRLDVGTSGLMVVARSDYAYSMLKRAFKAREVHKTYHALVQGLLDPLRGTIDAPVGRSPRHDWKFAVTSEGKPAITHYETLEAFRYGSLVEVHLETGRTHQIRVHMSHLGHPLAGDPLYGSDPTLAERLGLTRQWLHAVELSFEHPATGETVRFTSDYPEDLERALERLAEES